MRGFESLILCQIRKATPKGGFSYLPSDSGGIRTHLNATVRWTVACRRSRRRQHINLLPRGANANRIRPPQLYIDHNRRGSPAGERIRPLPCYNAAFGLIPSHDSIRLPSATVLRQSLPQAFCSSGIFPGLFHRHRQPDPTYLASHEYKQWRGNYP